MFVIRQLQDNPFALLVLYVLLGSYGCSATTGLNGRSIESGPGDLTADLTSYHIEITLNGANTTTFDCSKRPEEIETEPPYYLFECTPQRIALVSSDKIMLTIEHTIDGQRHRWDELSASGLLRRTTCNHGSGPNGEVFEGWDGESVEISGFDISADQVPGSSYYGR